MTRLRIVLAVALGAGLYAASAVATRITASLPGVTAKIEGHFTEGSGWHPGEPLQAKSVRAWGSWCGSDDNTGTLTLGPFAAPARLRLAVSGYPTHPGNQLYLENTATHAQLPIVVHDVGERWQLFEQRLPAEWRGQPVVLRAIDLAQQNAGWLAITEPVAGGRGARATLARLACTVLATGAVLWWPRRGKADVYPTEPGVERRWWFAGLIALVPFVWCLPRFREIWWFGDEWDQLDQISRGGFWAWTVRPFGENVVPLFKAAWGAVALGARGNYLPLLAVVWLTHAVNTALFARLLRRVGFHWSGTLLAATVFGLTVANSEILGWSIQWSNALAVLFLLLGLDALFAPVGGTRTRNVVLAICSAASALTFVRGILTGCVLAMGAVALNSEPSVRGSRWRSVVWCLAPTILVSLWIFLSASGNHRQLGQHGLLGNAVEFAAWFWAAVPLHRLLEVQEWDLQATIGLGAVKLVLIVAALLHARGGLRQLLTLLLLFDLGNAALLGFGRFQSGLQFANSSRYYYNSLICTLPFLAYCGDGLFDVVTRRTWRNAVAAAVVVASAVFVARGWPHEASAFAEWRGRNTRQILLRDANPPAIGAVPGIPFLQTERAKELIRIYGLH